MKDQDALGVLRSTPPDSVEVGVTAFVPRTVSQRQFQAAAEDVFAAAEDLKAAALADENGVYGYLVRDEFLKAVRPMFKGADFGAADGLIVPGTSRVQQIQLRCPVDGEIIPTYYLEPGGASACPRHPTARLILAED